MSSLTLSIILFSLGGPMIVHELGHMIVAKMKGVELKWKLILSKYFIPRGVFSFTCSDTDKRKSIKRAGFRFELGLGVLMLLVTGAFWPHYPIILFPVGYGVVAIIHRILYPKLNADSEYNDLTD